MSAPPQLPPLEGIIAADKIIFGLSYLVTSTVTVLFYEYIITIGDEIEHVWKRKVSLASSLYLINRYYALFGNIVGSLGDWSPIWRNTGSVCTHYVPLEGVLNLGMVIFSEMIMALRTYAIYGHNIFVLLGLVTLLIAQVIYTVFLIDGGTPLTLPPPFTACLLSGNPKFGKWASTQAFIPMIFDAIVFGLTLARTIKINRGTPTMQLLLRDGIMYFFVIFSANFASIMMTFLAAPALRNTFASYCPILTVIMVNRLTINLRQTATRPATTTWPRLGSMFASFPKSTRAGNLGVSSIPLQFLHEDTITSDVSSYPPNNTAEVECCAMMS